MAAEPGGTASDGLSHPVGCRPKSEEHEMHWVDCCGLSPEPDEQDRDSRGGKRGKSW